MAAIKFAPYAPNKGLTIASGAVNGLNNAMKSYMDMHFRKMQLENQRIRNSQMGQYYQARAAALNRTNMNADSARVQFAHDYASYLNQKGNPDAAKSVLKAAQPMVDKIVQGMPADQAAQYRQKIQAEINNQQPLEPEMTTLNPAEQKLYGQSFTNDTRMGVAQTNAGARVGAAQIYGDTRTYVADQGLAGKKYSADASGHSSAMKDVTAQLNQVTKSLSPNNPFSQNLDPETRKHLEGVRDDLTQQYLQLSNTDPKQFGKAQPAAGANGGANAPAQNGPGASPAPKFTPPPGSNIVDLKDWQKADKGAYVQHPDGSWWQSQGGGAFMPASQSAPAAAATPQAPAPQAPSAPQAAPAPMPAAVPSGG